MCLCNNKQFVSAGVEVTTETSCNLVQNIPWTVSNVGCTVVTMNKTLSQTLRELN